MCEYRQFLIDEKHFPSSTQRVPAHLDINCTILHKSAVLSPSKANSSDFLFIAILLPICNVPQRHWKVQQLSLFPTSRTRSHMHWRENCRVRSSCQLCSSTLRMLRSTSRQYTREESLTRDVEFFDHKFEWFSRRPCFWSYNFYRRRLLLISKRSLCCSDPK